MSVIIGSARISENGTINGKPGDQKQSGSGDDYKGEVSMQEWYLHKQGWVLIRPKNKEQALKIAQDVGYACNNPNVGYGQADNRSMYEILRKLGTWDCSRVNEKCNTDCGQLIRAAVLFAGIDTPDFYTGNAVDVLRGTGAFEILRDKEFTTKPDKLRKGDILCTVGKGHIVAVLTDGPKAYEEITYCTPKLQIIEQGDSGPAVKAMQQLLILYGYNLGPDGPDGDFGPRTAQALQSFQRAFNMGADAVCGKKTWSALINRKVVV